LAPIFRALAIVIKDPQKKHDYRAEMNSYERGQAISVNLVLTGSIEGLHKPIDLAEVSHEQDIVKEGDFQYATTTLHNALRFVSRLQDR